MSKIKVQKSDLTLNGKISLPGSKSISNRVLMMAAYGNLKTEITNLSTSDDTKLLQNAISSDQQRIDIGHAGTSFRFLISYYAKQNKERILTGSSQLCNRPIGSLVDALNGLGANISYLEKPGYAPLHIKPSVKGFINNKVTIQADISSQFITSLLMLGPYISGGLEIFCQGEMVSSSYVKMTIDLMSEFGIKVLENETGFFVPEGKYLKSEINVESDWSSASYLVILSALAKDVELELGNLQIESIQGDSMVVELLAGFGIDCIQDEDSLLVSKKEEKMPYFLERDFTNYPDLFQGISVFLSYLGLTGLFSGLETLKIKETDRIKAMKTELQKFNVFLSETPMRFSKKSNIQYYTQEGEASTEELITINTYEDHRMALAFSILAMKFPIIIDNPEVVTKSYPNYWKDLKSLGFEISTIET